MATKVSFYFDEHSPRSVQRALIEKGYEVIMAVDVDMTAIRGPAAPRPRLRGPADRPAAAPPARPAGNAGRRC